MDQGQLIPHLFRTEYRKIVAVLCKRFGFDQIEKAEDLASETFLTAAQSWGIQGTPPNPTAWLYRVAKHKAINHLRREHHFESKIAIEFKSDISNLPELEIDLSPQNISDSQLQMMFAICHPSIPPEAQIGLSLRILCGFGIEEIAAAFLVSKETINKRLFRAKEKLREDKIKIEIPDDAIIEERLTSVLTTIYLLFNEGYYSISQNNILRKDLCLEAIRLCTMLVENKPTNQPQVNALLALMCFHTSRFDARFTGSGELILYKEQNKELWNDDWISKGAYFLNYAATGTNVSKYHLEAGIAYWHTQKQDSQEKWENILQLYNRLLQLEYSPVAALNRTFALSKTNGQGKQTAILEAEKLKLTDNRLYFILLAELYTGIDNDKAKINFNRAISMAKNQAEKSALQKKVEML